MTEKANETIGYWLPAGTHEVTITQCDKVARHKDGHIHHVWKFTFEDDDWARAYAWIVIKESTKSVMWTLAAACCESFSREVTDKEVESLIGKRLMIKIIIDGEFPRIIRWRRLPLAMVIANGSS